MTGKHSGWDELFNPEEELEPRIADGARSAGSSRPSLETYLQLPGVRGAIQVTLDGVVLHQDVPGDIQYHAALTASIGSTARQVDRMLAMGGFEYAVLRMAADTYSTMIFRDGETFVGLRLSGEIAPTHIIARLRDPDFKGPG